MSVLVECIPNVSEGRCLQTVARLAEPFERRPGVALLHRHSDPDHHRTVFTTAGEPGALMEALLELYRRSVEEIDMREHRGVHPRLGAVDVCPFVALPAHGSSPRLCRELALELAERVAEELELPVMLYADSASSPPRRDLTELRRGQFEGLEDKLVRPGWEPDFGPGRPHPRAGATVIGARPPLVAYNVVLDSDDLAAARRIAAEVRESSGGLPGLKAMGVPLASRKLVQVSMNVRRPDVTPLHVAVDAVRGVAEQEGIAVLETELVGLMPLASVAGAAAFQLQLPGLPEALVLEEALFDAFYARSPEEG